MNVLRFVIAGVVVFVAFLVLQNFIVHGLILKGAYEATADVWREDMMSKMPLMYLLTLIISFLLVFIFHKGYEGRGLAEGLRFGFWLGLLMNLSMALGSYAAYPVPGLLALQWFIYGMIIYLIVGVIIAAIYRPAQAAAASGAPGVGGSEPMT
ncbi:hypothetical protein AMJ39_07320 [candidate division TA06 bacterium DG_24]|uniref:DUF1761 domain-containing protein n=2 Tax=Bacteria division TA06 TaxID=1156500 RepID=A0A0S8G7D5_UNCT6|nr:MAG: hypothetical protein AMJ39_07320 [candidate division TA06 bacterium DG_24]KPK68498.1 MAG: hypothetical protein AMJ82_08085 [candidate division TA06 bacterium SM23_40]